MIDVDASAVPLQHSSIWSGLAAVLIVLPVAPAMAQESRIVRSLDAVNPYAEISYTSDSNVFRLSDDPASERPDPGAFSDVIDSGRADQYVTYKAGLDWTREISRQEIVVNGFIARTDFDDYDDFDYSSGQALVQWNWKFAKGWDGDLGYRFDKRLRSFENVLVPRRDLREESKFFGSLNRQLVSNWVLNLRTALADISYSESSGLDLDRNLFGGAITYRSRSGNELGFDVEFTDGDFKESDIRNFQELDIGPTLEWQATERILVRGKVGWTWRDNESELRDDYDDLTGLVTFVRRGDGGNKIIAKVFRQVSNLGDEIANFALIEGVSVEPQWQVTSKIALKGLASYEDRDFKGRGLLSDDPLPDLESRDDQLWKAGVTADWQFNKVFLFSLSGTIGERNSNRQFEDFDYREVLASVTAEF